MKALTLHLHLLEPLLASRPAGGDENSGVSLFYLPGSSLRGALAGRYMAAYPTADLAADPTARRLFFDGSVCYLNAYPAFDGCRMLPTPLSWYAQKDFEGAGTVYDWAGASAAALRQPKAQAADFPFTRVTQARAASQREEDEDEDRPGADAGPMSSVLWKTRLQLDIHTAINDPNCRDERNQVFRQEVLPAGQALASLIVARDDAEVSRLDEMLAEGELDLGKAHRAGYGRVRVSPDRAGWVSYDPAAAVQPEYEAYPEPTAGRIIVTALSDLIVRGDGGQMGSGAAAAVAGALGMPGAAAGAEFAALRLVGGYNRKWGLPVAQAWAVAAGSVFVYKQDQACAAGLRTRAELGIGERCAEGFGSVAIDWQGADHFEVAGFPSEKPAGAALAGRATLAGDGLRMARAMAQRRLRLWLDAHLAAAVNRAEIARPPENAQLSRVRAAALNSWQLKNMQPLRDLLKGLRDTARGQLETARVDSQPLLDWLAERVEKLDVETTITRHQDRPRVAGLQGEIDDQVRLEYTARLIDGIMKKAARMNQEQKEGQR